MASEMHLHFLRRIFPAAAEPDADLEAAKVQLAENRKRLERLRDQDMIFQIRTRKGRARS